MSEPTIEAVAIALVVDSSLTIASEWIRILTEYVVPMLKRLGGVFSKYPFRVAVIIYGTAEERPSPLIAKRFFSPVGTVMKELRETPSALGLGRTGNGGGVGMAALEGLIAAIELFDTLKVSQPLPPNKTYVCHLFHIAASPPDNAERPMWNRDPRMDRVGWDSLPAEFRKRTINFSLISARQVAKFAELHASLATMQQPWFNVREPHILFLAGFPNKAGPKRVGDSSPERTPDPKRARLPVSTPSDSSPSRAENSSPAASTSMNSARPHSASERIPQQLDHGEQNDKETQSLENTVAEALAGAEAQDAAQVDRALLSQKYKAAFSALQQSQYVQAARAAQRMGANVNANLAAPTAPPGLGPHQPPPHAQPLSAAKQESYPASETSMQNEIQAMQNRTATAPQHTVGASHIPQHPTLPPQLLAQMQNMMERQQQSRATRPQGPMAPGSMPFPPPGVGTEQTSEGAALPDRSMAGSGWQGVLSWAGSDVATQGRKEVRAQVVAAPQPGAELQPDTWPNMLQLTPCRDPAVPPAELQAWIRRTSPALCRFQSNSRGTDPKANEAHFQSLMHLLTTKKIYAVAAWALPTGTHQPALLLFPINSMLIGAAFPLNGIPEYPKAANSLAPQILAQLQRMPSEQRNQMMQYLMRQRMSQQPTQGQQQLPLPQAAQMVTQPASFPQHGDSTADAANASLMFAGTNMHPHGMLGLFEPGQHQGGQPPQRHMGGAVQGAGGMGNVSYEMLQSFMHRNVNTDGSGMVP